MIDHCSGLLSARHRLQRNPADVRGPTRSPTNWSVQKAIRTLSVPLRGDDGTALIGIGAEGRLGAVSVWSSIRVNPGLHKIRLIAVSVEYRGTSQVRNRAGAVASEAVNVALSALRQYAAGERVFGLVDHRNTGSLRLLNTHGFTHLPDGPVDDPSLQMWAARIPR